MSKPLFIHIPKNAGTAINQSGLAVPVVYEFISAEQKVKEEVDGLLNKEVYKHLPISYLDYKIVENFERKFAVVRNPWSRVVSMYNYADKLRNILPKNFPKNYNKISFNEFLERRFYWTKSIFSYRDFTYDHWPNQNIWVNDNIDILRYENLNDDLSLYFREKISLPFVNVGTYQNDYRSYYNEESYKIILDWYKEDIDRWGFTFDSGATRNYWTNK